MSTPPVESSEMVWRQAHPEGTPIYFDPLRNPPVAYQLFLPSSQDHDGLSFIRVRFRAPEWAARRPEQPGVPYRLALLAVADMMHAAKEVGWAALTCVGCPDSLDLRFGPPWAHFVAAEVNRSAYDGDREAKRRIKDWAKLLARGLSARDVLGPFPPPDSATPHRPSPG